MISEKYQEGARLIGANISAYGHFPIYGIADKNNNPIENTHSMTVSEFLSLVIEYYNSKTIYNKSFGDDVHEQLLVKRFVRNIVKSNPDRCLSLGLAWIEDNKAYFKVGDII